jgi:hypothetical protein
VAARENETRHADPPRRGVLAAAHAVAVLLGCVLGARGANETSTPAARVGFALRQDSLHNSHEDLESVRRSFQPQQREVFDLVVALRGLATGGNPDWSGAEKLCRTLAWPRCERAALEQLRKSSRPDAGAGALESAPALAVANATWAFGSEDAVRKMFRVELDRLGESENLLRARVFIRFAVIETNPDGQAALFAQACVADPSLCDHFKQAAEREVQARFVPPGTALPLFVTGGHRRVLGPK